MPNLVDCMWELCNDIVCFSNDGQEFSGSIFQKVSDKLEAGAQMSWTGPSGSNSTTRFGIGAKFLADNDSIFRVNKTIYESLCLSVTV